MTLAKLREFSCKKLAVMAKRQDIAGWHAMRKDELIEALQRAERNKKRRALRSDAAHKSPRRAKPNGSGGQHSLQSGRTKIKPRRKPNGHVTAQWSPNPLPVWIAASTGRPADRQPGIAAVACDSHWIHVSWCLTREMLNRALAALGLQRHTAIPVVRVFDATPNDQSTSTEALVKEVEIGEDLENWYVRVGDPSRTYKVQIGLRAVDGRFVAVARSRGIQLPQTGPSAEVSPWNSNGNGHGEGNGRRRGARQNGKHTHASSLALKQPKHAKPSNGNDFCFQLDAELIVHGATHPDAELTLLGEPVELSDDGTFAMRVRVPEGRQVIPAQAITPNRAERRTIVLSLERNTKELEPQPMDEVPI